MSIWGRFKAAAQCSASVACRWSILRRGTQGGGKATLLCTCICKSRPRFRAPRSVPGCSGVPGRWPSGRLGPVCPSERGRTGTMAWTRLVNQCSDSPCNQPRGARETSHLPRFLSFKWFIFKWERQWALFLFLMDFVSFRGPWRLRCSTSSPRDPPLGTTSWYPRSAPGSKGKAIHERHMDQTTGRHGRNSWRYLILPLPCSRGEQWKLLLNKKNRSWLCWACVVLTCIQWLLPGRSWWAVRLSGWEAARWHSLIWTFADIFSVIHCKPVSLSLWDHVFQHFFYRTFCVTEKCESKVRLWTTDTSSVGSLLSWVGFEMLPDCEPALNCPS